MADVGLLALAKMYTDERIREIVDIMHPVGSVYVSVDGTDPSVLFGGTWERIQDRFLLCAGTTYKAGATGGEATVKLVADNVPKHSHNVSVVNTSGSGTSEGFASGAVGTGTYLRAIKTSDIGNGTAHNNMPPYLAVYVYKRVL